MARADSPFATLNPSFANDSRAAVRRREELLSLGLEVGLDLRDENNLPPKARAQVISDRARSAALRRGDDPDAARQAPNRADDGDER